MRYLKDNTGAIAQVGEDDDHTFVTLIAQTYEDEQGLNKPKYVQVGRDDPAVVLAAPVATSRSLVSGTAFHDSTGKPSVFVVQITGGSAGTVKVETSVDGSTYIVQVAATAANAVASQTIRQPVPAFGYIKVTVVTATIAAAVQVA